VSGYVLRWITPEDPLMQDVHALRHEVLFAPFGLERNDAWDDAGTDRLHLVALVQARPSAAAPEIAGYASLLLEADGTAHVRQLSVRSDRQRSGIGRALMDEAEAEARRRDIPLVWLNARVTAEGFYHRLGYETVSGVFASGRTGVPHVRMEKRLQS